MDTLDVQQDDNNNTVDNNFFDSMFDDTNSTNFGNYTNNSTGNDTLPHWMTTIVCPNSTGATLYEITVLYHDWLLYIRGYATVSCKANKVGDYYLFFLL